MSKPVNTKLEYDGDHKWTIEVDGHPLTNAVTSLKYEAEAGDDIPTLTLNLGLPVAIHHHALTDVTLDEDTTAALKAMGWAPPATQLNANGTQG